MNTHSHCLQEKMKEFMVSHSGDALCAVWDYSASPYALGDTLTWSMLSGIAALNAGKKEFDVCVITHRSGPASRLQPYVQPKNYHSFLVDVLPAFFVNPMLRDFHLYQDRESLEEEFFYKSISGQATFPTFKDHIAGSRKAYGLYNEHHTINRFFKENGFIPKLQAPRSYLEWAERFFKNFKPGIFFVCVHLRNRAVHIDQSAAELYRDGNYDDWIGLFDYALKAHPEVVFIVLGRPLEWPRELFMKSNVVVLKTLGYGLLEELSMVQHCDFFMATNSGPAVMAIFGDKPYLVFQAIQNSEYTSQIYGVKPGDPHLPFAESYQTFKWMMPDRDQLISSFEEKYAEVLELNKWSTNTGAQAL